MTKQGIQSATLMLMTWKNSFDAFLKNNTALNPNDIIASETEFGKEVAKIFNKNSNDPAAKNLNFQYLKIIQIAKDIHHLRLANDDTLPDWLEDELETVFQKIKDLLATIEKETN